MREQKPEEKFVQDVFGHINSMSFNAKEVVKLMVREHPTLQQSFTRLCYAWLQELNQINPDGRNEASVSFARKVVERFPEEYFPYI